MYLYMFVHVYVSRKNVRKTTNVVCREMRMKRNKKVNKIKSRDIR